MSGRIVGEVFENAPESLRPAEFLVLLAIAEDARDRDRLARYSDLTNLVRRTRLAPGTTKNALGSLVRRGLIKPAAGRARIGRHQEYLVTDLHDYHRHT